MMFAVEITIVSLWSRAFFTGVLSNQTEPWPAPLGQTWNKHLFTRAIAQGTEGGGGQCYFSFIRNVLPALIFVPYRGASYSLDGESRSRCDTGC